MSDTIYLSIGSNMGDRENYLNEAIVYLNDIDGVDVIDKSNIYETSPVGDVEQEDFLNIVVSANVSISPRDLLTSVWGIEKILGRERTIKWGPRTIDIDIVLWGDKVITESDLVIPHKEMYNREFVLVPLREIYKEKDGFKIDFEAILSKLDLGKVRRYYG